MCNGGPCGALNDFLAAAPAAQPVCGQVAAMVSVNDIADRPARALADGEILGTGRHALKWLDAPHVPHGWECGYLMELTTGTLLISHHPATFGATRPTPGPEAIPSPAGPFQMGRHDPQELTARDPTRN